MEMAIIIGFVLVFFFLLFLESRREAKKRLEKIRRTIRENWGAIPTREYEYEEFARIPHYYKRLAPEEGIDDITWEDLDLDAVFCRMNHTFSSVGEEYLYFLLRTPVFDEERLTRLEHLVDTFYRNPELAFEVQEKYALVGRARRIAVADYIDYLKKAPDIRIAKEWLTLAGLFAALVLSILGVRIAPAIFIAILVYNVWSYFKIKSTIESGFTSIAYLIRLSELAEEIGGLDLPDWEESRSALLKASEAFKPCRSKASVIAIGGEIKGSFADVILDYLRILFHVDLIAYHGIIDLIRKNTDLLDDMMQELGFLESCTAIASFRASLPGWCLPEFTQDAFCAEALYHPLIPSPVKNDIRMDRALLVTGSNASGKSTFLKACALCVILAQTIHTCPADRYEAPFIKVVSSMNVRDDIERGESYFMAEIRSLKRLFVPSDHTRLLLVDEVLRGTNTIERIAAAAKILESLADTHDFVAAATHDIELTYLLEKKFQNAHFTEEITDEDVSFSYLLKEGRADSKNALRLLKLMGYPEEITAAAADMARRFEETGIWEMNEA